MSKSIEEMSVGHGKDREETEGEELSLKANLVRRNGDGSFLADVSPSQGDWVPPRPILKTTDCSTTSSSSSESRGVKFDAVLVRSYSMTAGDHPECSYGCPVQLDWDYEEHAERNIDDYETTRAPRRKLRELVLSYYRRKALLERSGVSPEEQHKVARNVKSIKRQRNTTKMLLPASKVEELLASASRKIKRRTTQGGSKGLVRGSATA